MHDGSHGSDILAQATVLEFNAWTAPTPTGKRLIVRDRIRIKALQLP